MRRWRGCNNAFHISKSVHQFRRMSYHKHMGVIPIIRRRRRRRRRLYARSCHGQWRLPTHDTVSYTHTYDIREITRCLFVVSVNELVIIGVGREGAARQSLGQSYRPHAHISMYEVRSLAPHALSRLKGSCVAPRYRRQNNPLNGAEAAACRRQKKTTKRPLTLPAAVRPCPRCMATSSWSRAAPMLKNTVSTRDLHEVREWTWRPLNQCRP